VESDHIHGKIVNYLRKGIVPLDPETTVEGSDRTRRPNLDDNFVVLPVAGGGDDDDEHFSLF
jgi:hypothetical protein